MKTRKLFMFSAPLLGLLTTAPFAIAASCSSSNDLTTYKLLPTYTGQADILMSLGIKPDYYPYQLSATDVFSYIKSPGVHMPMQEQAFKDAFANKMRSLTPSARGQSWWNQFALQDNEQGSDPEYWSRIRGELVFYERYLLDDGVKAISSATAPKHTDSPATFILTNFRNSRDPFTRIPKAIIDGLLDQPAYNALKPAERAIVNELLQVAREVEGVESGGALAVDGKPAPSGKPTLADLDEDKSTLYNDYVFARDFHVNFLDNELFNSSSFASWIVDVGDWVFDSTPQNELALRKLFYASTYRPVEANLKNLVVPTLSNIAPSLTNPILKQASLNINYHHPIYEQQEEIGAAPMYEGAMRDNLLYLFGLASKLTDAATNKNGEGYAALEKAFAGDARFELMKKAVGRADTISSQLRTRMNAVKVIVDKINNPVLGIFTLSPGQGSSTIQSSSKYSFLYKDMGFRQPIPTNLGALAANPDASAAQGGSLFNMDDNGWWWDMSGVNSNIDANKIDKFVGQFDLGFLTANNAQYSNLKAEEVALVKSLWKQTPATLETHKVDYNLWNEGLKAPFGLHMLIDEVLAALVNKYGSSIASADLDAAKSWGSYFTTQFVAP